MTAPLLVTGGSGYLGGELIRRARGPVVATWHSREPDAAGDWLRLDVRDREAVRRAIERTRPHAVIHTAYRQDDAAVTRDGAVAVAAAAAAASARLVHLSTDLVFDGAKGSPYTEDDPPRPVNDYGRAKAEAEAAVLDAHPGALVVRTSLLYGGPTPSPPERDALAAARGESDMVFFTDELRSPVAVADLAAALLELAATEVRGILHVAGADGVSRHELARLFAAAHGLPPDSLAAGSIERSGLRRPRDCRLASDRAARLLATRLRGVREVLAPVAERATRP